MRRYPIFLIVFLFAMALPNAARAEETGSAREDFAGTGRRNERATYAFWDTRNKEISLPLQYTIQEVIPAETAASSEVTLRFTDVAIRFPRIPAGTIRSDAPVGEDGHLTFAAASKLYVNLAGGIELTNGRIPEIQGMDVRALRMVEQGTARINGRKGGTARTFDLVLTGFVPSSAVETTKLADAGGGKYFKKATLSAGSDVPEGSRVEYMLSADGGAHFEVVTPGIEHTFVHQGRELRFRAVLLTDIATRTPLVRNIVINFVKDQVETIGTIRSRDNRRISDLRTLADKLEKFKRERGVYPIVDDQYPRVRIEQLARLLIDGKFISKMPQDPSYDEDRERIYDYISSKSGNAYVLRARLEEEVNKNFDRDVDGKPVEPHLYEYTCDDPWYCQGKGIVVASPVAPPPEPRGTVELLQADDGKVWRIATVGGGAQPVAERKLYIPSPSLLERLKTFYARMQKVGREEIERTPRARLVKTADKNDVYYLTETWLKRRLPSWDVFLSYGNTPHEIAIVQPEEIEAYGESRLIRLVGDSRVWYLEGGSRRLVRTPEVMASRGFKWEHVAPVNFPEYNSYPEGAPLQ